MVFQKLFSSLAYRAVGVTVDVTVALALAVAVAVTVAVAVDFFGFGLTFRTLQSPVCEIFCYNNRL